MVAVVTWIDYDGDGVQDSSVQTWIAIPSLRKEDRSKKSPAP
jgi:hypothetical protein